MNQKFKKPNDEKVFTAFILLLAITPAFAQEVQQWPFPTPASDIKITGIRLSWFLKAVGGLVGFDRSSSVQQMDEWWPRCEPKSLVIGSNDFPHCSSRVCHHILCLK